MSRCFFRYGVSSLGVSLKRTCRRREGEQAGTLLESLNGILREMMQKKRQQSKAVTIVVRRVRVEYQGVDVRRAILDHDGYLTVFVR